MRMDIGIGSVIAGVFLILPAAAGTIYVSPAGANAGACGTAASPCLTLQRGVDRADTGGTVLLTEPGNYGPATIDKSVNIRGVPSAGVFSPGATPCLTFNGGANDVLTVNAFACDMDGVARDGIVFNSGHKLRIENTTVRGASGARCGVRIAPSSGNGELIINNSTFSENGTTGTNNGGGICIMPTGTAHLTGVIRNSVFQNGRHGIVANPTGSSTGAFMVDGSDLSTNEGGAFFNGNSTLCIRNSTITGNTFMALGGTGALLNGSGNTIWNNAADGAYTGGCP